MDGLRFVLMGYPGGGGGSVMFGGSSKVEVCGHGFSSLEEMTSTDDDSGLRYYYQISFQRKYSNVVVESVSVDIVRYVKYSVRVSFTRRERKSR